MASKRYSPIRATAVLLALVASYSLSGLIHPKIPRAIIAHLYAATWSKLQAVDNGTAQGGTGPYTAPAAGTVSGSGADLYACFAIQYESGHSFAAGDLTDVSGNSYTMLTVQNAAGDGAARATWFYKLAPATSGVEKWTMTGPTFIGMGCYAFSGSNGASSTVTSSSSGATSSTPQGGSVGAAGNLVLTGVGNYATGAASIDSSFQITNNNAYTGSNNMGMAIAWPNASGGVAGAVDPKWTMSAAPTAVDVYNLSITPGSAPPPSSKACLMGLLGVGSC